MTGSRAALLFRFYAHIELCRERLNLMRHLNPALPIYRLYGAPKEHPVACQRALARDLDGIWLIPIEDANWKWLHEDLTVREWLRTDGYKLDFDRIYDHVYDLLLTKPSDVLIPTVHGRTIALSGLKLLRDVRERWHWTAVEPFASHFARYLEFVRRRFSLLLALTLIH